MLARWGLPDLAYPVPRAALEAILSDDGKLSFEWILLGLQARARDGQAAWRELEPAISRLADLMTLGDERETVVVQGDEWWLEIGPVDLGQRIVTIQRDDCLVAAVCPRPDGHLRVAAYRPLEGKSAQYLVSASLRPHPEYGVNMRENNWEYLLDASSSSASFYAAERGEAYLSRWDDGLGIQWDGQVVDHWQAQRHLVACRSAAVAAQLRVHDMLGKAA